MANDSSTGGYLSPVSLSPPVEDLDLEIVLQKIVIGITGLPGNLVRPRWQSTLPKQPEPAVNWCALGITYSESEYSPAIHHNGADEGSDEFQSQEILTVLVTFYGPSSMAYAALLRDGLMVPQNNDMIKRSNLTILDTSSIRTAPEMVNQQWIRRYDIEVRMRRKVSRTYPVLNLLSADITTETD